MSTPRMTRQLRAALGDSHARSQSGYYDTLNSPACSQLFIPNSRPKSLPSTVSVHSHPIVSCTRSLSSGEIRVEQEKGEEREIKKNQNEKNQNEKNQNEKKMNEKNQNEKNQNEKNQNEKNRKQHVSNPFGMKSNLNTGASAIEVMIETSKMQNGEKYIQMQNKKNLENQRRSSLNQDMHRPVGERKNRDRNTNANHLTQSPRRTLEHSLRVEYRDEPYAKKPKRDNYIPSPSQPPIDNFVWHSKGSYPSAFAPSSAIGSRFAPVEDKNVNIKQSEFLSKFRTIWRASSEATNVGGLINLGNTCYMNAVIQVLLENAQFKNILIQSCQQYKYPPDSLISYSFFL